MRTQAAVLIRFAMAALLALSATRNQAQESGPMVRPELLRQVSPRVWIIPDESVPMVPNVGFVVGENAVLVIDTGLGPPNGARVAQVAQKLAARSGNAPPRMLYLVATHFHPEHDLGAQAFPPSTQMIRAQAQQQDIAEFGLQLAQVFASRSAINAELLKDARFRNADITFASEQRMDLGGVTVRMIAMGPNHTRGDTAIFVEGENVLFSGDVAMRPQPAFASPYSNLAHWLASLEALRALGPRLIVPSHGPTGGVELIEGYSAYLREVRERTVAAKAAGQNADAAIETVSTAMAARYPDRGRLAGAVRAAYAQGEQK